MSGDGTGFTPQFQRLLGAEQRRGVLEAIGQELSPSATLGEIVDAADVLGWSGGIGELRLIDLADVLLREPEAPSPVPVAADLEDEDEVEVEDEVPVANGRAAKSAKKVGAKKATAKKATSNKTAAKKAPAKKTSAKKTAAKKTNAKKTAAKKKSKAVPTQDAFDERMSLDEAVAAFVPLIENLGEASMQDLEEATGLGRRKLRFHVGQLVKHEHVTRHGMGRGTFYTV